MSAPQTSSGMPLAPPMRRLVDADREFIARMRKEGGPLPDEERERLPGFPLPARKDYSEHVTLIYDQWGGGCGSAALLGITNILKEMACRYTPDLSLRYLNYVFNETSFDHRDQRFPQTDIAQDGVLVLYGCCPEATWPTQFFPWPAPDPDPPTDRARDEAMSYRIKRQKPDGQPNIGCGKPLVITNPAADIVTVKQMLAGGPLLPGGPLLALSPDHVFAIVGYDDVAGEFTILNSWADTWQKGGLGVIRYGDFGSVPPTLGGSFKVESVCHVENAPVPEGPEFTGRIKVRTTLGRRFLVVKIWAEGKGPAVIWDYREHDSCLNLALDFPLPAYAKDAWPPGPSHRWCVEFSDYSPGISGQTAGTVDEVTLVQRVRGANNQWSYATYSSPLANPSVPRRGATIAYVPTSPT